MVYQKFISHFHNLPSICAKIICTFRNLNKALKYATDFENSLLKNDFKGYKHYLSKNLNKIDKKEFYSLDNSIGVFKVENVIHTRRDDGSPKFCPFLNIKLLNANSKKAIQIIQKIIFNGFNNVGYFDIAIDFSKNYESCSSDNITDFILENASNKGFHVNVNRDKCIEKMYFNILNDDYYSEDNEEEEEEEEEFIEILNN